MKRFAILALSCAFVTTPLMAQTAVTVNGKAITQKEIDGIVSSFVASGNATDTPELREEIKQELVRRTILLQAADKAGISKSDRVKQDIELSNQDIIISAFMQDYIEKNPTSEQDLKAEYDILKKQEAGKKEYKARHILFDNEADAKKVLADLKAKRTNFADAAKAHSKDPGSANQGGELQWTAAEAFVEEFANALQSQKKGELSAAPVKSNFGWHVIEVEDVRDVEFPNFEEAKPFLERMMQQTKLEEYQQSLFDAANVK